VVSELFLNPVVYFYLNSARREMVEAREHGLFQRWIDAARARSCRRWAGG
jgi:hypothetical protein